MHLKSKTFLMLITASFAATSRADGTGGAAIAYAFYFYILPIFLAIPAILISITDTNDATKKAAWIVVSIIIGVCSFYAPIWIYNHVLSYNHLTIIPLLLQVTPGYIFLLTFWIIDAKRENT